MFRDPVPAARPVRAVHVLVPAGVPHHGLLLPRPRVHGGHATVRGVSSRRVVQVKYYTYLINN